MSTSADRYQVTVLVLRHYARRILRAWLVFMIIATHIAQAIRLAVHG